MFSGSFVGVDGREFGDLPERRRQTLIMCAAFLPELTFQPADCRTAFVGKPQDLSPTSSEAHVTSRYSSKNSSSCSYF